MSKRRDQNSGKGVASPATKFVEFHGKKGGFSYYDKAKKADVELKPRFLVVKEMTTVTGFNRTNGGLFSNEVEDAQNEELDVRYHKGDNKNILKGLWADIKDKITSKNVNGKYTRAIYIALYHNKEWSLQHIKFFGMQFSSWLDMLKELKTKNINIYDVMVSIDDIKYVDNGDSSYYYPTFKYQVLDDKNTDQKAIIVKADGYYDIVEDFIEKRKSGAKENEPSARKAQSPEQSSQDTSKSDVDAAAAKPDDNETPFAEESEDDEELPW